MFLSQYFWPAGEGDGFRDARARLLCAFSGIVLLSSLFHIFHLYIVSPDLPFRFWAFVALCVFSFAGAPSVWHLTKNMKLASFSLIGVFLIYKSVMLALDSSHLMRQEIFFLGVPILTMVLLGSFTGWVMTAVVSALLVGLSVALASFPFGAAVAVSMSSCTLMAGVTLFYREVLRKERRLIELRNEAQRATKEKSEFLAKMSHEIRTPLNGISGILQLLDETDLTKDQKYLVETGRASGRSLMRLINDVLDYSKIAANGVTLERISTNCQQILETLKQSQEAAAHAKGLALKTELDPALPKQICADPTRINQILTNFVGNAIKFSSRGEIICRMERDGDNLKISVRDKGIGMTQEAQKRVFKKFEQASSSTNRHFGGTGLGLAISKELVELMEGDIGVESRPLLGSTFWFTIPLVEGAPVNATAPVEATSQGHMDFGGMRALVVEDNRTNQMIIQRFLQSMNVTFDVVEDGLPALLLCAREAYDIVLMDIQLPEMDGVTATEILRAQPGPNRHVPIVALTANIQPEQTNSYLKAGMNACLGKPFRKDELIKIMSALQGNKKASKPAA
ncbi:hypothetical protein NBRC116594_06560 [Shimia sp. NS0008-38b]